MIRPSQLRSAPVAAVLVLLLAACGGPAIEVAATATPAAITLGDTLTLTGTTTPGGETFAVAWAIEKAPAGSAATLEKPEEASTPFTPDVAGDYEVRFTGRDPTLRTGGGLPSMLGTRVPASTVVTITVNPRPAAKLVFRVQPSTIVAGVTFDPVVQVDILNSVDGVVQEATSRVSLALVASGRAAAQLLGSSSQDAVAGESKFTGLSVDKVGTGYTLTATVDGLPTVASEPFDVRPAALDLAHSTLTALPASAEVNAETVELLLVLKDVYDNAVPAVEATFTATGSGNTLEPATGTTNDEGSVTATLGSTRAEAKTITATFAGGTLETAATFTPAAPDADHSSLVISPDTLTADGTSAAVVTVTMRDAWDNPVPGAAVVVGVTGTANAIDPADGSTNADGVFVATLTSTKAESKTVSVPVGDGQLTGTVTFAPGLPDADHTTIAADPARLVADGVATSLVTVRVADRFDNPVPGAEPVVTSDGAANTLSEVVGRATDALGLVSYTLASTRAEPKNIRASLGEIAKDTEVVFTPGAIDLSTSRMVAVPARLVADGAALSSVTVTLRDAFENPVPGTSVLVTSDGTANTLTPVDAQVSDAAGQVVVTIASTKAESKALTATFGTQSLSTAVVFEAGAPTVAHSSFAAAPDNVVADGVAITTLTATLRDAFDNLVPGATVGFEATGTGNALPTTSATTGDDGVAVGTLASTHAEAKTVTLSFGAGLTLTTTVTFVPGPARAANSTFTASPLSLVADGTATTTLTATVRDANANPVVGGNVTFTSTGTSNTFSATTAVTNASGVATVTLKSTVAEAKTVTASFGVAQTLTAAVTFVPGAPVAANSTFTALPASRVADNASLSTLTATLKDANGNLVPGSTVTFSSTGTGNTFSATTVVTDANGVATATLKSAKAESKTVTAAFGTAQSLTAPVVFTPGLPVSRGSTLAASPTSLAANNTALATITATIRDAFSNPVPGVVVTFAATGTGNTLSATTGTTNASGVTSITIRSSVAEAKSLTARFGSPQITLTSSVVFSAGSGSLANSSLVASPTSLVANGTAASTLTATIRDATNNPVANAAVAFDVSGTGNVLSATSGLTNASGVATVTLTSVDAEMKTVTLSFGSGLTITTTVTFVAGPALAANSSFIASPTSVVANGTATTTLTATLRDANDNPVSGGTVTFTSTGTANTFSAPTAVSDASGVATVTLSSTKAEAKTATAAFGVAQALTTPVTFVAGPPLAANSTYTALPASVVADNTALATLTATLKDANGNPVAGSLVTFTSTGTANTLSAATATTNAAGVATVTLKSTKAEAKTTTASFGRAQSLSATVTFIAGAALASASALTASPTSLVANNTATTTLTATVRDANANPISGATVTFSSSGTANSFSATTAVTGATGVASVTLKSTKAEVKTVTAAFATGQSLTTPVTFVADVPLAANSTFTALPASVVANNIAVATLTATLKDANANLVSGSTVTFTSTGSANSFSSATAVTNASGVATVTMKSTRAEAKTTTAAFGAAQSLNAAVTFVAGPPDATRTTFTASPTTVVANDVSTSTLTLSVKDLYDNPIAAAVTLTSTGTGNTIATSPLTTSATGAGSATIRSNVDQVKTVTASIVASGVTITKTADVTFTEAPPEITLLTVPTTMSSCATITYSIKQLQSKPVSVGLGYDTSGAGLYLDATRHTLQGEGLTGLTSSPAGTAHTFVWNTTTDVAHRTFSTVRVTAVPTITASGLAGVSQTVTGKTVANALDFAAEVANDTGAGPNAIGTGDFNQDGFQDLVTGKGSGGAGLTLLMNNRAGGFTNAGTGPVLASGVAGVAVADFNGDGRVDVASASEVLSVFLTSGVATLTLRFSGVALDGSVVSVAAGDFDRDGDQDIVCGSRNGTTTAYRNDGTGLFTATSRITTTGTNQFAATLADFNKDGQLDWSVTSPDTLKVYVAFGDGAGAFSATPASYAVGKGNAVGAADLNRDGAPDLVVGNMFGQNTYSILINNGSGVFGPATTVGAGTVPFKMLLEDMDVDGKVDLMIGAYYGGFIFHKGKGDGTFESGRGFSSTGDGGMILADFGNDGRIDVAAPGNAAGQVKVRLNANPYRCDPGFRTAATYTAPSSAASPFLAQDDFDRDGRMDLVTGASGQYGVAWGQPNGTFADALKTVLRVGATDYPITALTSGDLNRDGYADLVFTSSTATAGVSNLALVALNQKNRTFAAPVSVSVSSGTAYPQSVTLVDMTGDGKLDLVVPRPTAATGVLVGNGTGGFGAPVASGGANANPFGSPISAAGFDFNRDGRMDVALTGNVGLMMSGNGAGALTSVFSGPDVQTFITPVTGDYNQDGWPDAALGSDNPSGSGMVRIFLNNKLGSFTLQSNNGNVAGATGLAGTDVDGDGLVDFILPGKDGNLGVTFMNANATKRAGLAFPSGAGTTLGRAASGDYNADGIPDASIVDTAGFVRVMMGR